MVSNFDESLDSGEDHYRNKIVSYLRDNGYDVEAVLDRRGKGPDIRVKSHPQRVIEVKGYPSRKVTLGPATGRLKHEGQIKHQARMWLWHGISQLVDYKTREQNDEIALGLPAKPFYCWYLREISWFRKELSVFVYLVYEEDVRLISPEGQIPDGIN